MKLEKILKDFREKNGISQRRMSELCGLSTGYINQLENGMHPRTKEPIAVTIPTLKKIASGMGVSFDSLVRQLDEGTVPDQANDEHDLLTAYRELNETGREKAISYIEDLRKISAYKI